MKATQVETLIEAPRDFAFAAFTDFDKSARILHQAARVDFKSTLRTGMGTEWEQERPQEGAKPTIAIHRIIAFNPSSSYVMTTDDASSFETMTFEFSEAPSGTRVSFKVEFRMRSFAARFMGLLFGGMVKRFMQEDLNRMRDHIEAEFRSSV